MLSSVHMHFPMITFCLQLCTDICAGSNDIIHVTVVATMWNNILSFGYFLVKYIYIFFLLNLSGYACCDL